MKKLILSPKLRLPPKPEAERVGFVGPAGPLCSEGCSSLPPSGWRLLQRFARPSACPTPAQRRPSGLLFKAQPEPLHSLQGGVPDPRGEGGPYWGSLGGCPLTLRWGHHHFMGLAPSWTRCRWTTEPPAPWPRPESGVIRSPGPPAPPSVPCAMNQQLSSSGLARAALQLGCAVI